MACQFGCVKGRSREEALMIQLVVGFRMGASGFVSALLLFDMSNAFPSISFEALSGFLSGAKEDDAKAMLLSHLEQA
eukprot:8255355-Alexandrium_andersonii.AAC.1